MRQISLYSDEKKSNSKNTFFESRPHQNRQGGANLKVRCVTCPNFHMSKQGRKANTWAYVMFLRINPYPSRKNSSKHIKCVIFVCLLNLYVEKKVTQVYAKSKFTTTSNAGSVLTSNTTLLYVLRRPVITNLNIKPKVGRMLSHFIPSLLIPNPQTLLLHFQTLVRHLHLLMQAVPFLKIVLKISKVNCCIIQKINNPIMWVRSM